MTTFTVLGLPAPQGSKTRMPNGALVEGSSVTGRAKTKSWRSAVTEAAHAHAGPQPLDGPLAVSITFRLPMPKSRRKAIQQAGVAPCSVRPDLDKLIRATLDGLTASGLIRDDACIFHIFATKFEVVGWTGATIEVGEA